MKLIALVFAALVTLPSHDHLWPIIAPFGHHLVKSATNSPKHPTATSPAKTYSANSQFSIVLVSDPTSDAVRLILRHKQRENRALLVCIAALMAMLMMGIIKLVRGL